MSGRNGTHKTNGHRRNGHTQAARANGVPHRRTGDRAAPLEPSATAATPTALPLAPVPDQPRDEGRDSSSGRSTVVSRVWHTAGATVVSLGDLLSEAAQQGAEPATGPPPAP